MALSIVLVGALLFVKADVGVISTGPMPGAEVDLALLAGLVALIFTGPGTLSIDGSIGLEDPVPRRSTRTPGAPEVLDRHSRSVDGIAARCRRRRQSTG